MSETLASMVLNACVYYWRDQVKTADIKLNMAVSALKKSKRLAQLNQN